MRLTYAYVAVGKRFRGILVEIRFALFTVPTHRVVGATVANTAADSSSQFENGCVVMTARRVVVAVATLAKKIPKRTNKNRKQKNGYLKKQR